MFLQIDAGIYSVTSAIDDLSNLGGAEGVILRLRDETNEDAVVAVLTRTYNIGIPVIIQCHHDCQLLDIIDMSIVDGLILENACILDNGQRRDYFRSAGLRKVMTKCNSRRSHFPAFFVGFYDLWHTRPAASVVKRAGKLAEHFGAIMFHGPSPELVPTMVDHEEPDISTCLSALQYLRRADTIDVQTAWIESKRKTFVPKGCASSNVAYLDVDLLDCAVPRASQLLTSLPVAGYLHTLQTDNLLQKVHVQDYAESSVRRDFWEFSVDNEPLSSLGCFPITVSASQSQCGAIIESQRHLKEINMLHRMEGSEINEAINSLKTLLNKNAGQVALIQSLIDGLSLGRINVYKGLHTGFTLPGGATYFWGVSSRPPTNAFDTDIYISKKCPNDTAIILHTWFAHNGVPRLSRFEDEIKLQQGPQGKSNDLLLPVSISAALDAATESELLLLLQQLRMSGDQHPFGAAIERMSTEILLDGAAISSWRLDTSRGFLNGTVSMRNLIQRRLGALSREGATELPLLENILALFGCLSELVEDALLAGNRSILDEVLDSLYRAYDPSSTYSKAKYVDINAEIVALLFFCALRKAALDEVYIEATDRCPYFLSQPDQAAVFAELWVLGSQCESFFGMPPRDVGAIVYNRYREHLNLNPPPAKNEKPGDWTAYLVLADQSDDDTKGATTELDENMSWHQVLSWWHSKFVELNSMSIFCLPAVIDVVLLSFLGRGLFMSAFMKPVNVQTAVFALLMSLLLTAGVTGLVGAVGNYYLAHVRDTQALRTTCQYADTYVLKIKSMRTTTWPIFMSSDSLEALF